MLARLAHNRILRLEIIIVFWVMDAVSRETPQCRTTAPYQFKFKMTRGNGQIVVPGFCILRVMSPTKQRIN